VVDLEVLEQPATPADQLQQSTTGVVVLVVGAEVVAYSRSGEGIYRELFLKNGRIVGGALVGDISGAGVLHAAMNADVEIDKNDEDLLKPKSRALRQVSIRCFRPRQRVLSV